VSNGELGQTAAWYQRFADNEAAGASAIYEAWARGVVGDAEVVALIDELPRLHRQPNLIFAVSRLLGAPEGDYPGWRTWLLSHWPAVRAEASLKLTQTNEPGRVAALLPALAMIPGPLALLEVGAAAGLCLYPDRYSVSFDGAPPLNPLNPRCGASGDSGARGDSGDSGDSDESAVMLTTRTTGAVPIPKELPNVVWRAGLDLYPLDVANDADMKWLVTLSWPEHHERRARIEAAITIAREDPPTIVRGDAVDALSALAATAPAGATLVIISAGVLVYLPPIDRERFEHLALQHVAAGARWVSLEGAAVLPGVESKLPAARPPATGPGLFVLALDGEPLAWVGPHGQHIHWLS
jgi:hypothetical protein